MLVKKPSLTTDEDLLLADLQRRAGHVLTWTVQADVEGLTSLGIAPSTGAVTFSTLRLFDRGGELVRCLTGLPI
jgi:hypothetical protein